MKPTPKSVPTPGLFLTLANSIYVRFLPEKPVISRDTAEHSVPAVAKERKVAHGKRPSEQPRIAGHPVGR